jgi:hypothetical protein
MTGIASEKLWRDEAHAYAVVVARQDAQKPEWSGLSHAEAMRCAEGLRQSGATIAVMHVVGGKSYEVDCYPVR